MRDHHEALLTATARVAGDLGHEVPFVVDATRTLDRAPNGSILTAAELARVTATNLHGELATLVIPTELL